MKANAIKEEILITSSAELEIQSIKADMAESSTSEPTTKGRQFKATHKWNNLVLQLRENVTLKRRKNAKLEYFTGANAVDVLHLFVKHHPDEFKNSSVSRENIVRLCQSFVDMSIVRRILENDSDKLDKFEDSSTAFYSFIDDSDFCQNYRQVLREIDGEISNGFDHITISKEKKFGTKHSSLSLRNKRRPHFPSFGGLTSQSTRSSSTSLEQSCDTVKLNDQKVQHPVKRSSSLVRQVVKRSTSDPNLQQSLLQTPSSSENEDNETKAKKTVATRSSVRLRFSQRLSFRKKSASDDNGKVLTIEEQHRKVSANEQTLKLNGKSKKRILKVRRSLQKVVPSPQMFVKYIHKSNSYQIEQSCEENASSSHSSTQAILQATKDSKRRFCDLRDDLSSPPKMVKVDPICDTPNRIKSNKQTNSSNLFADFGHRISLKSQRKQERSTKSEKSSYVLRNPLVTGESNRVENNNIKLNENALAHLQRDCIRVRLLQLLDISFVDDIIASPTTSDTFSGTHSFDCENNSLSSSFSQVASLYKRDDPWITSAVTLLYHLPNSIDILHKYSSESNENKKIKLFFSIYEYYNSKHLPFIPQSMSSVVDAVIQVLETKPVAESLEVVQLFLNLLPKDKLLELRHLAIFLSNVINDSSVALSSQCSNKIFILQSFPSSLLPSNNAPVDVASGPAGVIRLIIEKPALTFSLPSSILKAVERKKMLVESGQIPSPTIVRDNTFSTMIAPGDYEAQKIEFTQKQLKNLAKFISSDSSFLSSKKKKDFLKKLQSSHPAAYTAIRQPVKSNHVISTVPSRNFKPPSSATLSRRRKKNALA